MNTVYVGDGKTISRPDSEHYKWFDYKKINEYLKAGKKITAGMREDWYFTAKTLDNNKLFPELTQGIIDKLYELKSQFEKLKEENLEYYGGGIFHDDKAPKKLINRFMRLRKQVNEIQEPYLIAGLMGSSWDTPIIKVDDGEEHVDCYVEFTNPRGI